jgi:gas vesicle protein
MDITGFDIGATLTAVGALVKAFHSGREVKKNEANFVERFVRLEERVNGHGVSLQKWDERFANVENKMDKIDDKIDENSRLLNKLVGFVCADKKVEL